MSYSNQEVNEDAFDGQVSAARSGSYSPGLDPDKRDNRPPRDRFYEKENHYSSGEDLTTTTSGSGSGGNGAKSDQQQNGTTK